MNRVFLGAFGLAVCIGAVACGSASASGATATPSPSANRPRGFAGNAAFGQLVQINGSTLILSNSNGNSTVTYGSTTRITQTATETVADITAGDCIVATGSKGADGSITATSVTLSAPTKGSCTATGFGGGGFGGAGGGSPRPSFSPGANFSPPAGISGLTFARGQVKAVSGTTVTIAEITGTTGTTTTTATVTVPDDGEGIALHRGDLVGPSDRPVPDGDRHQSSIRDRRGQCADDLPGGCQRLYDGLRRQVPGRRWVSGRWRFPRWRNDERLTANRARSGREPQRNRWRLDDRPHATPQA